MRSLKRRYARKNVRSFITVKVSRETAPTIARARSAWNAPMPTPLHFTTDKDVYKNFYSRACLEIRYETRRWLILQKNHPRVYLYIASDYIIAKLERLDEHRAPFQTSTKIDKIKPQAHQKMTQQIFVVLFGYLSIQLFPKKPKFLWNLDKTLAISISLAFVTLWFLSPVNLVFWWLPRKEWNACIFRSQSKQCKVRFHDNSAAPVCWNFWDQHWLWWN